MSNDILVKVSVENRIFNISVDQCLPCARLVTETMRHCTREIGKTPTITSLFNRTKNKAIFLEDSVSMAMSSYDLIEALNQPESNQNSNDTEILSDRKGLFYDQLRLFQYLGRHLPPVPNNQTLDQTAHLKNLLSIYIGCTGNIVNVVDIKQTSSKVKINQKPSTKEIPIVKENMRSKDIIERKENKEIKEVKVKKESSKSKEKEVVKASVYCNVENKKMIEKGFYNVFDVVFYQQAIGMKLGADDSKNYAVVKECFEGSEASRYTEIKNGIAIVAVNGENVEGIGLSRTLFKLREAKRPVNVRFGMFPSRVSKFSRNPT